MHRFAASSEILPRAVHQGGETNVGCNGCLLFVATAVVYPLQALIVGAVRFGYKRCGLAAALYMHPVVVATAVCCRLHTAVSAK